MNIVVCYQMYLANFFFEGTTGETSTLLRIRARTANMAGVGLFIDVSNLGAGGLAAVFLSPLLLARLASLVLLSGVTFFFRELPNKIGFN